MQGNFRVNGLINECYLFLLSFVYECTLVSYAFQRVQNWAKFELRIRGP